jgi:hypothetical protein
MLPRFTIAYCPRCNEVTPHEDHRFGRWSAIVFGLAGIGLVLYFGWLYSWFWLGALIYGGAWFALDRHERRASERCTRCRNKAHKAWRKTQPDPRNSTIDLG